MYRDNLFTKLSEHERKQRFQFYHVACYRHIHRLVTKLIILGEDMDSVETTMMRTIYVQRDSVFYFRLRSLLAFFTRLCYHWNVFGTLDHWLVGFIDLCFKFYLSGFERIFNLSIWSCIEWANIHKSSSFLPDYAFPGTFEV